MGAGIRDAILASSGRRTQKLQRLTLASLHPSLPPSLLLPSPPHPTPPPTPPLPLSPSLPSRSFLSFYRPEIFLPASFSMVVSESAQLGLQVLRRWLHPSPRRLPPVLLPSSTPVRHPPGLIAAALPSDSAVLKSSTAPPRRLQASPSLGDAPRSPPALAASESV